MKHWLREETELLKQNFSLPLKDLLLLLPNKSKEAIEGKKSRLKLKSGIKRKYIFDYNFFENYNILSAYWAGFLAADGNIRDKNSHISLTLSSKDRNHIEQFKNDINFTGFIKDKKIKRSFNNKNEKEYFSSSITICGAQKTIEDLWKNYNIGPRKSLTIKPPTQIKEKIIKYAFIIGIIDGDGTISLSKNKRIELSIVGTKEMMEWIKEIFDFLEPTKTTFNLQVHKEKKKSNIFRYKITGFRALKILNYLNKINIPKLQRKWYKISFAEEPIYKNKYNF